LDLPGGSPRAGEDELDVGASVSETGEGPDRGQGVKPAPGGSPPEHDGVAGADLRKAFAQRSVLRRRGRRPDAEGKFDELGLVLACKRVQARLEALSLTGIGEQHDVGVPQLDV